MLGRKQKANTAFIEQVVLVSDMLGIHESKAATLVHYAINQQARFDRPAKETAMFLYHAERGFMLACLKLLLTGLTEGKVPEQSRRLFAFHVQQLLASVAGTATTGYSFHKKTLDTISKLKDTIANTSATNEAQFGANRIERLTDERKELGHVLFLLSFNSFQNTRDTLALLTTLQTMDRSDPVLPYVLSALLTSIDISPSSSTAAAAATKTSSAVLGGVGVGHDTTLKQHPLVADRETAKSFNEILNQNWVIPDLRAVIALQWGLFLKIHIRSAPVLEQEIGLSQDKLERMVESSVVSNAFQFIAKDLLAFRRNRKDLPYQLLDAALGKKKQKKNGLRTDEDMN